MKNFLIVVSLFLPKFVFAASGGGVMLTNYLKAEYQSVPCLIGAILDVIVQVGSMLLVVFIVITGLKFVTAKGNSAKLEEAKQALLWTIVGAAIVLGAFVISEAVKGTVEQLGTSPGGVAQTCP